MNFIEKLLYLALITSIYIIFPSECTQGALCSVEAAGKEYIALKLTPLFGCWPRCKTIWNPVGIFYKIWKFANPILKHTIHISFSLLWCKLKQSAHTTAMYLLWNLELKLRSEADIRMYVKTYLLLASRNITLNQLFNSKIAAIVSHHVL